MLPPSERLILELEAFPIQAHFLAWKVLFHSWLHGGSERWSLRYSLRPYAVFLCMCLATIALGFPGPSEEPGLANAGDLRDAGFDSRKIPLRKTRGNHQALPENPVNIFVL